MGESLLPETGRITRGVHHLPLRVYYEDTDAGGVVYHANYLRFFERARTEMFPILGIGDIAQLAAEGLSYVVVEADLRCKRPAKLGDILVIETHAEDFRGARCVVKHRVIRNGEVLVEGRILLALIGADGRPRAQPARWLEAFRAAMGANSPE